MEPLLVDVKYTYHGIHLDCPLGCLGGRHLPSLLIADATHAHPVYR